MEKTPSFCRVTNIYANPDLNTPLAEKNNIHGPNYKKLSHYTLPFFRIFLRMASKQPCLMNTSVKANNSHSPMNIFKNPLSIENFTGISRTP